jgi:uncharacterized protein YggE
MTHNRLAIIVAVAAVALGIGVAVVVSGGSGPNGATAATPMTAGDIVSVSGTGSVEGVPDTLMAGLRVHVREPSVQQALNDSATDARQVIASLKAHGLSGADIRTTDVSLDPDYNDHGEIDGYDASESLSVRIHPLTSVGKILTAASSSAGNAVSVDGLSFDIADNTSLLAAARASAFANAKAAAAQYAQLGDSSLGKVVSIKAVVHNASPTYPGALDDKTLGASVARNAALPIAAGRQKVSVTVKVIWALQ